MRVDHVGSERMTAHQAAKAEEVRIRAERILREAESLPAPLPVGPMLIVAGAVVVLSIAALLALAH
jgi:ApbE superfamily uncharacterized protein (UPF0280 family)